jgi:hypothetical protein
LSPPERATVESLVDRIADGAGPTRICKASALALAELPAVTKPPAQAEVAEDDAARGSWLPSAKLRHPYPDWRFDVMTRGGSPMR